MSKKYRSPWWVSQRWSVETIANSDGRGYRKGDWIAIYSGATRAKAEADAKDWTKKTGQLTRIVPGAGHKTKRGF